MKRWSSVGLIIAWIALSTISVFAETEEIVGKKIEGVFKVKVNGKTLEKEAIVVEGTSYLPVRAVAESLGLEVEFNPNEGINLSKKGESTMPMQTEPINTFDIRKYEESKLLYKEKASRTLKVKSTVIELPDRGDFSVSYFPDLDGETYIPIAIFSKYIVNEPGKKFVEFNLPNGRSFSVERNFYFPGCDMFYVHGAFREDFYFVKLSLTGYSAREDGEYLIIE